MCHTLTEFGTPMKPFRLTGIYRNQVHTVNNLSDIFSIQNGLKKKKKRDALLPLLFKFALENTIKKVQEN